MKKLIVLSLIGLGVGSSLTIGCGQAAPGTAPVGSAESALGNTGLVPYPVKVDASGKPVKDADGPIPTWDGTVIDLMAADAYAQCAARSPWPASIEAKDQYLGTLGNYMERARCSARTPTDAGDAPQPIPVADSASTVGAWALQRIDPLCNVDPTTRLPKGLHLTLGDRHQVPADVDTMVARRDNATQEVNYAELNLCMAQRLREITSSGDGLVLSAVDQRALLEVVRERAQLAMLQYAAIGGILAGAVTSETGLGEGHVVVPLQAWGQRTTESSKGELAALGGDFAAAVQLQSIAADELADLLWRSGSARLPRGGDATSFADDAWGEGSWRQRLMALLYGGDPLVEAPKQGPAAPWNHFVHHTEPGDPQTYLPGFAPTVRWPSAAASDPDPSYVRTSSDAPEVDLVGDLARRADALYFKIDTSGTVGTIDRVISARRLYTAIEAFLLTSECRAKPLTCQAADLKTSIDTLATDNLESAFRGYRIWARYRIRPSHAESFVAQMADALPKARITTSNGSTPTPSTSSSGIVRSGFRVVGADKIESGTALGRDAGESWYHVDPDYRLVPLDNVDRAPLYSRLSNFRIPTSIDRTVTAPGLGLLATRTSSESARILGAVSALAATRDTLRHALPALTSRIKGKAAERYFANAPAILNAIDAAIGPSSLAIQPLLDTKANALPMSAGVELDGCWPRGTPCTLPVQKGVPGQKAEWRVDLVLPSDHPFVPATGVDLSLVVLPVGALPSTLAESATATTWSGGTLATIVAQGAPATPGTTDLVHLDLAGTRSLKHQRYTFSLAVGTKRASLVLKKSAPKPDKPSEKVDSYLVVAEDIELDTYAAKAVSAGVSTDINYPVEGQYLAYEGQLGLIARRAWTPLASDPSVPAYDGFGLPIHWVPPADPRIFGSSGEDATAYYMRTARSAADEATAATKSAIESLLKEQSDDAALATAQRRAAEITTIEQRSLCGDQNPSCDTSMTVTRPTVPIVDWECKLPKPDGSDLPYTPDVINSAVGGKPKIDFQNDYVDTCKLLKKVINDAFTASRSDFSLGKAVVDARKSPGPPDFAAYSGGAIQTSYAEQWQTLRRAENSATELKAAGEAAWARVDEAYRLQVFKTYKTTMACGRDITLGILAGLSVGASFGPTGGASVSFSPGPMLQAMQACQDARNEDAIVGNAAFVTTLTEAFSHLAAMNTAYADAISTLQTTAIRGQEFVQKTNTAEARAALEASLAGTTLETKFKSYRRYHSFDMWRARALLESARRYSVAARRALESRFVVDLSTMHAAEPLVAAPSTWADEIYEYDLDVPASVGLTAGAKGTDGVYANRISDYVGNLERFINGYAISRPTAVASRDDEVFAIGGPNERVPASGGQTTPLSVDAQRWQFHCPDGWRGRVTTQSGATPPTEIALADVCGGPRPDAARFAFNLDPWGRVDGDLTHEPFQSRYNARWGRFALNLVGTGIKECARAAKPSDCYASPFLPFDLRHVGRAWTTDYDQTWHVIALGMGRVEAGKALAAEQWLDPITNGWGRGYVDSVARSELQSRPFGGAYVVEIALDPEVHPERIERAQILLESSYWVSQK